MLSGALLLSVLSMSVLCVSLCSSQVTTTRVMKEMLLFYHRKCAVRMIAFYQNSACSVHVCYPLSAPIGCHALLCQSPFCSPSLAARKDYAILLRDVSRQSAGKGRAVLEYFGSEVERFYVKESENKEEAVQSGLLAWARGKVKSYRPTTWEVLIGAMEHADISVRAIDKLKEELQKGVCTCTYVYVSCQCGIRMAPLLMGSHFK